MNYLLKKVRPGLSTTGKEVRDRLKARQMEMSSGKGDYSVEDEVMKLNSMSRVEIARAHSETARKVIELQAKVNEQKRTEESRKLNRTIEQKAKAMAEKFKQDATGNSKSTPTQNS